MYLPNLTSYITLENSQGTLDPLSLYSIADKLALRLAPDLRERMKHPRYLTAIAAGAVICSEFGDENLASDEISPPYQVYEWHIVSALVKRFQKDRRDELLGMPGREKATNALKLRSPLSAITYLKTPSVFGFHGVYRTLATGISLTYDNQLGEFGTRLLDVWEKEQGLEGFRIGIRNTKGYELRSRLQDAVLKAKENGQVTKPWSWEYYNAIAEYFAPKSPGILESNLLFERLLEANTPSRAELIRFLISQDGQKVIKTESEKQIHNIFLEKVNYSKEIIKAIQAYEYVARLLYNAFYESLQFMDKHQGRGSIKDFISLYHVKRAITELPEAFKNADIFLEPYQQESSVFFTQFQPLRETFKPTDWVKILFEYHRQKQRDKPPSGKAAWLLENTGGNYLLNTSQMDATLKEDEYVHQYRSFTLQSFMKDLKKI